MRRSPAPVPPALGERVDLVEDLKIVPVQNPAQNAERADGHGTTAWQGCAGRSSMPL